MENKRKCLNGAMTPTKLNKLGISHQQAIQIQQDLIEIHIEYLARNYDNILDLKYTPFLKFDLSTNVERI